MKGEQFLYCPIMGKRVRVSGEILTNTRQDFNMSEKKGFCKAGCQMYGMGCVLCNVIW